MMLTQQQRSLLFVSKLSYELLVFVKQEGKKIPVQAWRGYGGFQEVEAPRFPDTRHMKVAKLSALRTGCLYPAGNIPGTHF
jgi:hypothetical protein